MFKGIFIVTFVLIISGCDTIYVKKNNHSIVATKSDITRCEVEAYQKVPVNIQTSGVSSTTIVTDAKNETTVITEPPVASDVNAFLRDDVVALCMDRLGYTPKK